MPLIKRLSADLACLKGAVRALRLTIPIAKRPTRIFPQLICELAQRYGDTPALLSERERFTYAALAARSNRFWRCGSG